MSVRLSCPSCNTAFALDAIPDHRRATCPRCGDVFPVRTFTEVAEDRDPKPEGTKRRQAPSTNGTVSRKRVIGLALLFCSGLGLLGIAIVLVDRGFPRVVKPILEETVAPTATPPSQLVALGYLRADCNIVFAVQPGPLLDYAARTKQTPRDVLGQAGLPDSARNVVEQFGVPLSHIDHIAGGVGVGEDALHLALVLVLKQPLADEEAFLKELKAKPVAGKQARHDVMVGKFPLLLTQISPTVWVFGLDEKDFDAVEKGGFGTGGTQFPSAMRTMIAAVPSEAGVWVTAEDDDWARKPIVKGLMFSNVPEVKKWLPVVKDGRGALVAVSLGEQPRLNVRVRVMDAITGDRVRAYFKVRATETASATSGGDGAFAYFDAPFDPTNSGKLLQRFLNDAGR